MKGIKSRGIWAGILAACMPLLGCSQPVYKFKKGDPEGSGKWYMGREIAPVMSHYGIGWLERSEREAEEQVTLLLEYMHLQAGEWVADIGAGSGYHTIRIAQQVGVAGYVAAVDIQPEMLAYIQKRLQAAGIMQAAPVQGSAVDAGLPASRFDKMLLVDVYHEMEYPAEMLQSLLTALKPGGMVYLVEYRAEDPDVPIKQVHKMTEQQAVKEWTAAGFIFVENKPGLPWQHCLVFQKPL